MFNFWKCVKSFPNRNFALASGKNSCQCWFAVFVPGVLLFGGLSFMTCFQNVLLLRSLKMKIPQVGVTCGILCCFVIIFFYALCNDSSISFSSWRNCLSVSARLVTALQACKTVAWSRLPMYCPIFEVDISRYFLEKYIATWRTSTTSLLRERVLMLSASTP